LIKYTKDNTKISTNTQQEHSKTKREYLLVCKNNKISVRRIVMLNNSSLFMGVRRGGVQGGAVALPHKKLSYTRNSPGFWKNIFSLWVFILLEKNHDDGGRGSARR